MSQEILKEDLAALDAAENVLSALVTGEKSTLTADFGPVYARLTGYWAKYDGPKLGNCEMMKHVARMFITISEAKKISGFQCQEFSSLLKDCKKLSRAKNPFMRRGAKKCNSPNTHTPGCCCARLKKTQDAQTPVTPVQVLQLKNKPSAQLESAEQKLRRTLMEAL